MENLEALHDTPRVDTVTAVQPTALVPFKLENYGLAAKIMSFLKVSLRALYQLSSSEVNVNLQGYFSSILDKVYGRVLAQIRGLR